MKIPTHRTTQQLGKKMILDAWDKFIREMKTVNLGNGSGIMNEEQRIIRQNEQEYKENSKTRY